MLTRLSSFVVKLLPLLFLVFATETASAGCGTFCRGKPLDSCQSFWVLEGGCLVRLDNSEARESEGRALAFLELGHMRNVTSNTAVGCSIYGSTVDGDLFGLKGRFRHWLGQKTSLEFAPGIILGGSYEKVDLGFPGFVGSVAFNYGDWVGLILQFQALRYQRRDELLRLTVNGTEANFYVGARLGSWATLAFPVIFAIAVALTLDFEFELDEK